MVPPNVPYTIYSVSTLGGESLLVSSKFTKQNLNLNKTNHFYPKSREMG